MDAADADVDAETNWKYSVPDWGDLIMKHDIDFSNALTLVSVAASF